MALEPDPEETWLLAGPVADATEDDAPENRPAHRARHADVDRSSLIAVGKGVAAVIGGCAAVALVLLALNLGRSSPGSHRAQGERGIAAALPPAAGSSDAPSSQHRSQKPSRSASPSPSRSATPTPRASTTAAHAATRSSPARAVPPQRSSSHSRTPSPAPTPKPSTSHLTYTIPGHSFIGKITLSLPDDWTIKSWSGGTRNGNTWRLSGGQLTVTVGGPSGSNETMTATMNRLGLGVANYVQTYRLN